LTRILAGPTGANVSFEPGSAHATVSLTPNSVVDIETAADFVVTSDQPVLVAQFMYSGARGQPTPDPIGDPSLVFEIPSGLYRAYSTFLTPSTYAVNFVNIVAATGASPTLDGAPVTAQGTAIGTSGLTVWKLPVGAGAHTVGSQAGTVPFGVKVYGAAPATSYAYSGGFGIATLNSVFQ
jgi:hypothetical protein